MMKIDEILNKTRELTKEVCEVVVDGLAKRHRRYFSINIYRDGYAYKGERAKFDDRSVSGSGSW